MTSSKQGLTRFICRFKAVFMGINFTLQRTKAQFVPRSYKRKQVAEFQIILTNQNITSRVKRMEDNTSLGRQTREHHLLRSPFLAGFQAASVNFHTCTEPELSVFWSTGLFVFLMPNAFFNHDFGTWWGAAMNKVSTAMTTSATPMQYMLISSLRENLESLPCAPDACPGGLRPRPRR